jgi:bifunctional non-homologous end joining protein LigD
MRSPGYADYMVIGIESPETALGNTIEVALAAKQILSALQLPSFIKTDGMSGLHVYVPLDSKTDFGTSKSIGEYICKLIRLKIPHLVALKGSDDNTYGKVILDYLMNEEGNVVVAPYSLVRSENATVATPLLWEEVNSELRLEAFNHETIFNRLNETGDPFENLFKKKVDGEALLEKLDENYAFLF